MIDASQITDGELQNFTMPQFGLIGSKEFQALLEHGFRGIGDFSFDELDTLYCNIAGSESEGRVPDLRQATIGELATTYRDQVDILLIQY